MKKSILFISAFPPSNKTAGQNYTSQLLADISKDNHVTILYWDYPNHEPKIPSNVSVIEPINLTRVRKVINAIWSFFLFPLFTVRFDWTTCRMLKRIAGNYDILYFDFSQVFLYSIFISHPCKIFMCHDVISQKYSRNRFSSLYLWYVKISEKILLRTANLRMCFSKKDADYIYKEFGLETHVVSFYIDNQIKKIDINKIEIKDNFIFYGAWNRPENYEGLIWFCKNVLPECDIKCVVIGGGLSDAIREEIECTKCKYLGFVNDPYPFIASNSCLIAPIFNGAGVKVKVIESLALGTPVIGTDIAFEGIDNIIYSENKKSLIIANNKEEFIARIKSFVKPLIREKVEIQKLFLENYRSNTFKSMLQSL